MGPMAAHRRRAPMPAATGGDAPGGSPLSSGPQASFFPPPPRARMAGMPCPQAPTHPSTRSPCRARHRRAGAPSILDVPPQAGHAPQKAVFPIPATRRHADEAAGLQVGHIWAMAATAHDPAAGVPENVRQGGGQASIPSVFLIVNFKNRNFSNLSRLYADTCTDFVFLASFHFIHGACFTGKFWEWSLQSPQKHFSENIYRFSWESKGFSLY